MLKQGGVALGAGLASALLFVVSAKGTAAASLIAYFTALPLIISTLSFGYRAGLASSIIGLGAVSFAMGPVLGVFFALCFAVPGWWLSYLFLLAQPVVGSADNAAPPRSSPTLIWYPVGRLTVWAAALAAGAVLIMGGIAIIRFGGFEAASQAAAARIGAALDATSASGTSDSPDVAVIFVRVLPIAMSASLFLMMSVNLWLGARVADFSQRLKRPWPNVPDGLRLPQVAAIVVIVCLLPAFSSGAIGTVAGTIAAALGLAFALQGLATAHVLTRGFGGRRAILALIYLVTVVVPVAVIALALIGLVDCLFSFRDRRPPTIKRIQKTGG